MTFTLNLPMPPSVNSIWRTGRNRRTGKSVTYLDKKYTAWIVEADAMLLAQKPLPKITGHFTAILTLDQNRRRGDADNRVKGVLDLLQRVGIIENDRFADRITVQWGEADGCSVQLVKV
jgi:crossover junction endodeoxyribonuclease RusA